MQTLWTGTSDELGPRKVLFVLEPKVGLEGVVVVDNVACGPAIGGIRMAPDVTVDEVARLARAMTLKNAASGLPHGGGKAGILAVPAMDAGKKETLIRAFGRAIANLTDYIPGPDMGTDKTCMAWLKDEMGRALGTPQVLGGIPLDTIGATGYGVAVSAEVAQDFADFDMNGARVVMQGFGAVGQHGCRFLRDRGAVIVAVSDSRGGVHNPNGLSLPDLLAFKASGRSVHEFPGGAAISADELIGVDCEVWVPAARPYVLTIGNVSGLKAKVVIQGANIPASIEAEIWMHEHGVLSLPDFITNAGGVISAAVEYGGGTQGQVFAVIDEKVRENTKAMLERARATGSTPRAAAEEIAMARLREAQRYRR